jgi:hypothetical protein
MSSTSPVVVLYSSDGYQLAVQNGVAIPTNTRGLLIEGSDGTDSRFITIDTSGRLITTGAGTAGTPVGGVITIQGIAGGTAVPISGTVTTTLASIGATGATAPTSADLAGAQVSTSVLSGLTNGDMYALSMTTTGLLRVDGSNVTQPVSGTVTANAGTGNFTVVQTTASNLNATVVGIGTAGTPSGGVLSIQGVSGGQAVSVTGFVTTNKATTSNVTSVVGATSNTVVLASNANRVFATIYNATNVIMYAKMGVTASLTSYSLEIFPGSYWEVPNDWTGEIDAVWASSVTGSCLVTELTP